MTPRELPDHEHDDADLPEAGDGQDALDAQVSSQVGAIPEPDREEIAGLSYEQARDELADVVARLEGGQLGLEESMALWKRGEALAEHCAAWLEGAERVLTQDERD